MNQLNNSIETAKSIANNLKSTHLDYIKFMGAYNHKRLIGKHETS